MGVYAKELREIGYEPTGRDSPFDENGELWTNSFEIVCDETARVIDKGSPSKNGKSDNRDRVFRYSNSGRVKLLGGFLSSYDWGKDEDGSFFYEA